MKELKNKVELWAKDNTAGIFVFNMIIILLVLLRSAGYFDPFFKLTINLIVLISVILSIFLLSVNSRAVFVFAIIFWILAAFFKIIRIDIWAERMGNYTYEILVIAILLLLMEYLRMAWGRKKKNV